jgi:cell division protein FtsQ
MTSTVRGSGGRDGRDRHSRKRTGRAEPDDPRPRRATASDGADERGRRASRSGAASASGRSDEPPSVRGRRTSRGRASDRGTGRSGRATTRDTSRPLIRRSRAADPDERSAPTRGRYLARRWIALLVAVTVVAVAYLVLFTSLLGVRSVEVIGVKEIPKDAVLKAAAIADGTPMVRLDAEEAAARVAALPRVSEVVVERSWPSTVEIIVTERTPVAVLMVGAEVHLVDATGLDYAVSRTRPPALPTLAMTGVRPGNPATSAAVTVLGAIPKQLKAKVTQITARTPGDVRMTLSDGRTIKWGNARNNQRKAAVLAPLLTRPGTVYDVATPDFPTVAG